MGEYLVFILQALIKRKTIMSNLVFAHSSLPPTWMQIDDQTNLYHSYKRAHRSIIPTSELTTFVKGHYEKEKCKLYATQYGFVAIESLGALLPTKFLQYSESVLPEETPELVPLVANKRDRYIPAREKEPRNNPLWIVESEFTGKVQSILGQQAWVYNRNDTFTLKIRKFTKNGIEQTYLPITGFGYKLVLEVAKLMEMCNGNLKVYVIRQRRPKGAIPLGLIRTKTSMYLTIAQLDERTKTRTDIFQMQKLSFSLTPITSAEGKTNEYVVRITHADFSRTLKAAVAFVAKALVDIYKAGFSTPSFST